MSKMGQTVNHTLLLITSWNHALLEDKEKLLAALNVLQVMIETSQTAKNGVTTTRARTFIENGIWIPLPRAVYVDLFSFPNLLMEQPPLPHYVSGPIDKMFSLRLKTHSSPHSIHFVCSDKLCCLFFLGHSSWPLVVKMATLHVQFS